MTKVLIVCFGNPLRCDDGLGWLAAEELSRSLTSPSVDIITCYQLTPELADNIHSADLVIFVDATRSGEPGEIAFSPVVPSPQLTFSHELTPAAILAFANQLYGRVPSAFAATVCGKCFDLGETISPMVAASLPRLTALITETVHHALN